MSGYDPLEEANHLIDHGNQLEDAGDLVTALERYQQAATLAPDLPRCHLNLANIYGRLGRHAEVVPAIQRAINLDPSYAPSHFNLGLHHAAVGQFEEAAQALRAALALDAHFAHAAIALANVLEVQHAEVEAESLLRGVDQSSPLHVQAATNLALLLTKRGALDEAESLLNNAVRTNPAFDTALLALANVHLLTGRAESADRWFRAAIAANPQAPAPHSALLFSMNARDDLSAEGIFNEHVRFGERFLPLPPALAVDRTEPTRRVRIGYVSADFRQHAVALFMRPVLAHHERKQFEIFCYSNTTASDAVTRQIESTVEHWREVVAMDDHAMAALIRADGIDLLVDLSGHTGGARLGVFALRAAPIQVSWLGYLNTSGLRTMDYRVCDNWSDPVGQSEHLHTERLLRMPHSQWCYEPATRVGRIDAIHPSAEQPIVFGSFNQSWKIAPTCLAHWAEILASVPQSELRIVGVPQGDTETRLRERLGAHGITGERVLFLPRMSAADYFASIGNVDIALDTFPYNGGTTTLDALWMGVPVVALAGKRSISRSSYSILSTLGEPRLVAKTPNEYVDINVELARDASWRRAFRSGLRHRLQASPLMDAAGFARALEDLFRQAMRER